MDGRERCSNTQVTKLPKSILAVCQKAGVSVDQVDWFRGPSSQTRAINEGDRLAPQLSRWTGMPGNIERFGNTSARHHPDPDGRDASRRGG